MADLPLCYIEWPGLKSYFDAQITIGQGTSPGVCVITCPLQDTPIAPFGELRWISGNTVVTFPACRVDKIEAEIDPDQGRILRITILDRRWLWEFGSLSGWYNVRLGNLAIKSGTEATPQQLAEMCLEAMGEFDWDVSEMPNDIRPEVRYDPPVVPARALQDLCDMTACRVAPKFNGGVFTGVKIVRMGHGEPLPPTDLEFNEGYDTAELPNNVGVYLAPTLVEVQLPLIPVISTDLFSNVTIDLNSLFNGNPSEFSYYLRYPVQDPNALPVYDPEKPPAPYEVWREVPAILRKLMQVQEPMWHWFPVPQVMPSVMLDPVVQHHSIWTRQMQDKLKSECMLCYQVRLPFEVPGWGTITSHDQYVLEVERAETYEDMRTGVIRRAPAYVYGSFRDRQTLNINSEAYWNQLNTPVDPDKQLVYQGGISIDPENRIVRFGEHMIRDATPPDQYTKMAHNIYSQDEAWTPKGDTQRRWEPAQLVLVTAIRLMFPTPPKPLPDPPPVAPPPGSPPPPSDPPLADDHAQYRYSQLLGVEANIDKKGLPVPEDPYIEWSTIEDIELRAKIEYKMADDYKKDWITPVKWVDLNLEECKKNCEYYLTAALQKYQTKIPQRATYPGLAPIDLDGAIEQVSFSSSSSRGAFTVACRHSEWAFGLLLPYGQRRQIKELYDYRKSAKERAKDVSRQWKSRIFMPSNSGGQFGYKPPG